MKNNARAKNLRKLCRTAMVAAILLLASGAISKTSAQSTIYLCYDVQFWEQFIPIKVNGQELFEMQGEPKRVGQFVLFTRNKMKCVLDREGKVVLSFAFDATIPTTGAVVPYSDEIQLTLTPGSEHYITMEPVLKGNKIVFKELDEKTGKKEFANKKYTSNPDYVE